MTLVWPSREQLDSYADALRRGWSPDNVRGLAATEEELARIGHDPDAFVSSLVDRDAKGERIVLDDGTTVPRLPGYTQWMWDGEFCGSINFRWQPGTEALPPHCLGHIGYGVVPWKQGLGYATEAVRAILPAAAAEGLRYVEIMTAVGNDASRRVIEKNGGTLIEEFVTLPSLGSRRELRFRISLELTS